MKTLCVVIMAILAIANSLPLEEENLLKELRRDLIELELEDNIKRNNQEEELEDKIKFNVKKQVSPNFSTANISEGMMDKPFFKKVLNYTCGAGFVELDVDKDLVGDNIVYNSTRTMSTIMYDHTPTFSEMIITDYTKSPSPIVIDISATPVNLGILCLRAALVPYVMITAEGTVAGDDLTLNLTTYITSENWFWFGCVNFNQHSTKKIHMLFHNSAPSHYIKRIFAQGCVAVPSKMVSSNLCSTAYNNNNFPMTPTCTGQIIKYANDASNIFHNGSNNPEKLYGAAENFEKIKIAKDVPVIINIEYNKKIGMVCFQTYAVTSVLVTTYNNGVKTSEQTATPVQSGFWYRACVDYGSGCLADKIELKFTESIDTHYVKSIWGTLCA